MATASGGGQSQFSHSLGSEEFYDLVCQPCQLDGQFNEVVGLCTDCQEYLCQRCFDVHTLPTPTRNHKLLNKKQMVQQQVSLRKEDKCSEKCAVHEDEVIKYYCIDHYQLGCSVCITLDHRSCDNVRYIPHVARDLANNEEYKQAEYQLKSVMIKSNKVSEESKQKTDSTEETCSDSIKMVKQFRREMNETLDRIEADLINKCETLKSEELKKTALIVETYKTAQKDLELLYTMTETYQNKKQNCNLYIAMMKAKDTLTLAEESLIDAEKNQSLINSQIKFVPNKQTLNKLMSSQSFGKLSKSRDSCAVIHEQTGTTLSQAETPAPLKRTEPKTTVRQTHAQTTVNRSEPRTIITAQHVQDIKVKSSSDKKSCTITGIVVIHDNRLVVTDHRLPYSGTGNGNVKLVDIKKGQVITNLALSSDPWDVTRVTSNQVAVALPKSNKIAMINVETTAMTVDRTLDVSGKCQGVDYRDGKLAVAFCNPDKVEVYLLDGRMLYSIAKDKQGQNLFNSPEYVMFGSKDHSSLYVSNWTSASVVHVKLDGTVVGRYTDMELDRPTGLATDSSGNIYICGEGSNNIHKITLDCRKMQVLLTEADGLDRPKSISYNELDRSVYVGMYGNNVVKEYSVTPRLK